MSEHSPVENESRPNAPREHGPSRGGMLPGASLRLTGWQRFKLIFKVVEVRLRFIAILIAVALFVSYWDAVTNHWEKQTRADGVVYRAVRGILGSASANWLWPQSSAAALADSDSEYYCPMHPNVVRSQLEPGGVMPKCPICGMPLSARKKGIATTLPDGVLSRTQLSPDQIQMAGVETAEVSYRPLTKQLMTVGYVGYDESGRSRIVTRVGGYLEKLVVDKPWLSVNEGDPLAEIYSPELYSAARELLLAIDRGLASELARSGREKLRLLGISDKEIDEIAASRGANHRLIIRSPRSGHVIRKDVVEGAHVTAGQTLFEIADLDSVWIEAEVYETDIAYLREGQPVEATVEAFRNRVFRGRVSLVHPHLDSSTRTNAVRLELANSGHELRPGMFATVRIDTPLGAVEPFASLAAADPQGAHASIQSDDVTSGKAAGETGLLAVPERSVIDTGSKRIVYVERAPGRFEGVEVELGPRVGGFYPVVKGLQAGDRVAAAGAFLIDAETRLNPAAAGTYVGAGGTPRNDRAPNVQSREPKSKGKGTPGASAKRLSKEEIKNVTKLAAADRELALAQRICPVTGEPLGSMGVPHKITVEGETIFLCCQGCESELRKEPQRFLKKIAELKAEK